MLISEINFSESCTNSLEVLLSVFVFLGAGWLRMCSWGSRKEHFKLPKHLGLCPSVRMTFSSLKQLVPFHFYLFCGVAEFSGCLQTSASRETGDCCDPCLCASYTWMHMWFEVYKPASISSLKQTIKPAYLVSLATNLPANPVWRIMPWGYITRACFQQQD